MSPVFSLMPKEQQEYLQRSKKFPVMVCLPLCVRAPNNDRKKKTKTKTRVIMTRTMMVALTSMSMKSISVISHICIFAGQNVFCSE